MSIEKLEEDLEFYRKCITDYQFNKYDISYDIEDILQHTIDTFKHQSDQIADLRQEISKKD